MNEDADLWFKVIPPKTRGHNNFNHVPSKGQRSLITFHEKYQRRISTSYNAANIIGKWKIEFIRESLEILKLDITFVIHSFGKTYTMGP